MANWREAEPSWEGMPREEMIALFQKAKAANESLAK